MNVLISWSGDRSKKMASVLNNWIPKVIQIARPWMSDEDISTGSTWNTELNQILENTAIGIICVTPENQQSIWLHFEAGALSKSISDSKVMPLLLDMIPSQLSGPMSQFQAVECQKEGVLRIMSSINKSLNDSSLKESDLAEIFDVWWPRLEKELNNIAPYNEVIVKRESSDMLEEIIDILRDQRREQKERLEKLVGVRDQGMQKIVDNMNKVANGLDDKFEDGALIEKLKLAYLSKLGENGTPKEVPQELIDLMDKQRNDNPMKELASLMGNMQESMIEVLNVKNESDDNDNSQV